MTIAVVPNRVANLPNWSTRIALFEPPGGVISGSVGNGVLAEFLGVIGRTASARAWDLAALAMAVTAADRHVNRLAVSEDGWTRALRIDVAVTDPELWCTLSPLVERMLSFLTGDIWTVGFVADGLQPSPPKPAVKARSETCVSLLSGGLDSLIGAIDLSAKGERPIFVSNRVRGDCRRQRYFALQVGAGDSVVALNHNARTGKNPEISQRPRSLAFIAFGVLAATTLDRYIDGAEVDLHVPENGFISLNVPLTRLRSGSLSTRTTHPVFIRDMQELLVKLGLRVRLRNEYALKTKGEMMAGCSNPSLLAKLAPQSMSCGRSSRPAGLAQKPYRHCGRCLPCLVRRAAIFYHGKSISSDTTPYAFPAPGGSFTDGEFRHYDDVMQCLEAIDAVEKSGLRAWIGSSITAGKIPNPEPYRDVARRGLLEIGAFLREVGAV